MTAGFVSGTVWTGGSVPLVRGINSSCADLIFLAPPLSLRMQGPGELGTECENKEAANESETGADQEI